MLPEGTEILYLGMLVKQETEVSFCYSLTEEGEYIPVGQCVEATPGRWVGVKAGLTAINESGISVWRWTILCLKICRNFLVCL